jgi:hypothetical protein
MTHPPINPSTKSQFMTVENIDEKIMTYIQGDISEAWISCLEIWRDRGRIEDLPIGQRKFTYIPWFGKSLAFAFLEKFNNNIEFLIEVLNPKQYNSIENVCVCDLLRYITCDLHSENIKLPIDILTIDIQLPTVLEVESKYLSDDEISIGTIGEFLRFYYDYLQVLYS